MAKKQLLHLVFGGELKKLGSTEFRDLDALDIVGIYPNYRTAQAAWKAKAQASVDNAHMRYFVVHSVSAARAGGQGFRIEVMDDQTATAAGCPACGQEKGRQTAEGLWRKIREPLAESRLAKGFITSLFAQALRFVKLTNRPVEGIIRSRCRHYEAKEPGIIALWHGQHLLAPVLYPSKRQLVAMVSRSADAELNAMVVEKFGIEAVRGSGGRDNTRHLGQGRRQSAGRPEKGARRRQERCHDRRYTARRSRARPGWALSCSPAFLVVPSSAWRSRPAVARCWNGPGTRPQ